MKKVFSLNTGATVTRLSDTVYTLLVTPTANRQDLLTVLVQAGAFQASGDAEALKAKIAQALANVKDLPWGDQGVLDGFAATDDKAYDVVRQTAKALKLDLGSMK